MIDFRTYDDVKRKISFEDGILQVTASQDVAPVLKAAEEARNNECSSARRKEEFRKYASIPVIFVEAWMREHGITEINKALTDIIMRKVNTEFTAFKTTNTTERVSF